MLRFTWNAGFPMAVLYLLSLKAEVYPLFKKKILEGCEGGDKGRCKDDKMAPTLHATRIGTAGAAVRELEGKVKPLRNGNSPELQFGRCNSA